MLIGIAAGKISGRSEGNRVTTIISWRITIVVFGSELLAMRIWSWWEPWLSEIGRVKVGMTEVGRAQLVGV